MGEGRDPGQKKVTIPPAKHENHNFSTCSPTLALACLFDSSKNGTMLRDRVFEEVIKAKRGHIGGLLVEYDWFLRGGVGHRDTLRKGHVRTQGGGGHLQAKEREGCREPTLLTL